MIQPCKKVKCPTRRCPFSALVLLPDERCSFGKYMRPLPPMHGVCLCNFLVVYKIVCNFTSSFNQSDWLVCCIGLSTVVMVLLFLTARSMRNSCCYISRSRDDSTVERSQSQERFPRTAQDSRYFVPHFIASASE